MDSTVNELLIDNLVDPAEFAKDPSALKTLECFHFNLPKNPNFSVFTGLVELRVIEQDIMTLNWLKDCKNLLLLTVYHTQLKETSGLKYSPCLKQLILEGNKLDNFPDVSILPNLVDLSVAENPIFEISEFPKNESIQTLNISSTGISYLSNTIVNFPNIKKLQLAGNNLHDFAIFKVLGQLKKLQELYLYDPNYEENPICSFPNYDVLPAAYLPNISILDTYKISDKMKNLYQNRRKQAELYYLFEASSNMSVVYDQLRDFHSKATDLISSIDFNSSVNKDIFAQIYNIIYEFDKVGTLLEEFHRQAATTTFQSGGCVSIEQLDANSDKCREIEDVIYKKCTNKGEISLAGVWKVVHLATKSEVEEEDFVSPEDYVVALQQTPLDTIKLISDWHHTQGDLEVSSTVTVNSMATVILCDPRAGASHTLIPEYIGIFCQPFEDGIQEIEKLCNEIKASPAPKEEIKTEDSLMLLDQPQFDITPSLVNITLSHCGITSLSIFKGLENLRYLSVPFNEITTLNDLPEFPELDVLDVSFNKIETIQDLLPNTNEAADAVKLLLIFGNKICSPKVINLTMQFFPNALSIIDEPKIPLYVPIAKDPSIFLTSIFPENIQLETITSLDFRNQCLVSLAPLGSLPNLKILYASDNMLRSIDFSSKTLTFGDFSLNEITEFPSEEQFPAIEALLLNGNHIEKLVRIQSLLALFISDNKVSELITSDLFPNIVSLSCIQNPVLKLYNEQRIIFSNPKLKMLNGTVITTQIANKAKSMYTGVFFKETSQQLLPPGTKELNLSGQGIKDINAIESSSLLDLDLSKNNLTNITWTSSSVPHLKSLNLSTNAMILFDFANYVPQLRVLDVSANKINDETLECLVQTRFPVLQTLIIANNSIKTIQGFNPDHLPNLETLSLSHNFINKIAAGAFDHPKLANIDLSYNSLKKLDNIAAPQILSLDISHNRVSTVDEVEKLRGCSRIQKFAFNDNSLTQRISPRIRCLSILRSLKEMDGRVVSESDLNQVRIIIEQMTGGPILSARGQPKAAVVSPSLPPLQGGLKKKTLRFPR